MGFAPEVNPAHRLDRTWSDWSPLQLPPHRQVVETYLINHQVIRAEACSPHLLQLLGRHKAVDKPWRQTKQSLTAFGQFGHQLIQTRRFDRFKIEGWSITRLLEHRELQKQGQPIRVGAKGAVLSEGFPHRVGELQQSSGSQVGAWGCGSVRMGEAVQGVAGCGMCQPCFHICALWAHTLGVASVAVERPPFS